MRPGAGVPEKKCIALQSREQVGRRAALPTGGSSAEPTCPAAAVCEEEIRDASKQTFLKKQERAMAKKLPESSLFDVRQDPRSGEAMGERHSFAADDDCSAAVIRWMSCVRSCAMLCYVSASVMVRSGVPFAAGNPMACTNHGTNN